MYLHTHEVPVEGEEEHNHVVDVWVLHVTPVEARFLADALEQALTQSPDSASYSVSLGTVDALTPPTAEPEVQPGSGLILP